MGVVFAFLGNNWILPAANAQSANDLPVPGVMVSLSPAFEPILIKGLKINFENPFAFDFIIDTGSDMSLRGAQATKQSLTNESSKLIKYFLAAMTVPEKDLWVNLSPYEKDRMIAANLGQTQMGRDMLAQDYLLKQLTASLIYPEKDLGKKFWDDVYAKAQELYGTTQVPVNTFNKVWIVADQADVFEQGNAAYVVGAHLKVMLEEDYLAVHKHMPTQGHDAPASITSQIIRQVILPQIENEVNQGRNFAPLRQMFYSMILASWYKKALKDALLTQLYGDQSKLKGLEDKNGDEKDAIYQRYLKAYRKGVFNYIKEDIDKISHQQIPRQYFSGGLEINVDHAMRVFHNRLPPGESLRTGSTFDVAALASPQATNILPKWKDKRERDESIIQAMGSLNGLASAEELAEVLGIQSNSPRNAAGLALYYFKQLDWEHINQQRKSSNQFQIYPKLLNSRTKKAWNRILRHIEERGGVSTLNELQIDLELDLKSVFDAVKDINWNYINSVRRYKNLFPLKVFYNKKWGEERSKQPTRLLGNGLGQLSKRDDFYDIISGFNKYYTENNAGNGFRSFRLVTVPLLFKLYKELGSAANSPSQVNELNFFFQHLIEAIIDQRPQAVQSLGASHKRIIPRNDLINYYFQVQVERALNISSERIKRHDLKSFKENLERVKGEEFPLVPSIYSSDAAMTAVASHLKRWDQAIHKVSGSSNPSSEYFAITQEIGEVIKPFNPDIVTFQMRSHFYSKKDETGRSFRGTRVWDPSLREVLMCSSIYVLSRYAYSKTRGVKGAELEPLKGMVDFYNGELKGGLPLNMPSLFARSLTPYITPHYNYYMLSLNLIRLPDSIGIPAVSLAAFFIATHLEIAQADSSEDLEILSVYLSYLFGKLNNPGQMDEESRLKAETAVQRVLVFLVPFLSNMGKPQQRPQIVDGNQSVQGYLRGMLFEHHDLIQRLKERFYPNGVYENDAVLAGFSSWEFYAGIEDGIFTPEVLEALSEIQPIDELLLNPVRYGTPQALKKSSYVKFNRQRILAGETYRSDLKPDRNWYSDDLGRQRIERYLLNLSNIDKSWEDQAMAAGKVNGGIDLSGMGMQMNVSKEDGGVQMKFDPALIARIKTEGIEGLEFHIQSIVPVTDLPLFLGLDPVKEN